MPKSLKQLKLWTSLLQHFVAKALTFDLFQLNLQVVPRNVHSIEGKRHANTTPLKLLRSENSKHSTHVGTMFACLMIRHFEEVAGFLCPEEVIFHSQDDKAKGSIRLTATNKQALLVMHIECNVRLPDHNFLIAKQQKLVALVIVDIEKVKVKTFSSDAVTYS